MNYKRRQRPARIAARKKGKHFFVIGGIIIAGLLLLIVVLSFSGAFKNINVSKKNPKTGQESFKNIIKEDEAQYGRKDPPGKKKIKMPKYNDEDRDYLNRLITDH